MEEKDPQERKRRDRETAAGNVQTGTVLHEGLLLPDRSGAAETVSGAHRKLPGRDSRVRIKEVASVGLRRIQEICTAMSLQDGQPQSSDIRVGKSAHGTFLTIALTFRTSGSGRERLAMELNPA
jgi:hypothetical protein